MQTSPDIIRTFMAKKRLKSLAAFYMLKVRYAHHFQATPKSLSMLVGINEKTMKKYLGYLEEENLIEWQSNGNLRLKSTRYNPHFLFTVKINKSHTLSEVETLLYGKLIECNCFAQAHTIRKKRKDNALIANPKCLRQVKRREKIRKNSLNAAGIGNFRAQPVNAKIVYTFDKLCRDANISRSKANKVRNKLKEMNQVKFIRDNAPIGQCGIQEFEQNRHRLLKEYGFVFWRAGTIIVNRPCTVVIPSRPFPSLTKFQKDNGKNETAVRDNTLSSLNATTQLPPNPGRLAR